LPADVAIVQDSALVSPHKSVHRRPQQVGISQSSVHQISKNKLHLRLCKIQLIQEMKLTDHGKRRLFAEWILSQPDADFTSSIIFGARPTSISLDMLIRKTVEFFYVNNSQFIQKLMEEIRRIIGGIGREVFAKVITNFNDRLIACRDREGRHLLNIIFYH
jgi:hypothetical protein